MHQPDPRAEYEPGADLTTSPRRDDLPTAPADPGGIRYLAAWVLPAAVIAGLGAWACGESTLDYFQPSAAAAKNHLDPRALNLELSVLVPKNASIAFGMQGALLGLLLGLAVGLARRSVTGGITGGIGGLLLGALAGIVVPLALVPIFMGSYRPAEPNMMLLLMIRGGIWAAIGAAAGLAFGLGSGRPAWLARTFLGGLAGGFAGTLVFEIANALIDPLDRNDKTIPTTPLARVLSYLLVAVFVALGTLYSVRRSRRGRPSSSALEARSDDRGPSDSPGAVGNL